MADETESAAIVVGTRGRTAVQSALLGSVSSAVVHHSRRPVLVVPVHAGATAGVRNDGAAPELAARET